MRRVRFALHFKLLASSGEMTMNVIREKFLAATMAFGALTGVAKAADASVQPDAPPIAQQAALKASAQQSAYLLVQYQYPAPPPAPPPRVEQPGYAPSRDYV